MQQLFELFTESRNRGLLYSLYPYLWEVKEETYLLLDFLENRPASGPFVSSSCLQNTCRGSFIATLQSRLQIDAPNPNQVT
jgi:hypothetical protein